MLSETEHLAEISSRVLAALKMTMFDVFRSW